MSRHFLITAFPPTPESCRQALALPSTTRTRHIRLRVCLSLLLCAVLLGGIACAASGYGVFRFLLGNAQPGDALLVKASRGMALEKVLELFYKEQQ